MLTFKFVADAGGAAHYFQSADDYYEKEGHNGTWIGKGAAALGLAGRVDKTKFKDLLDGKLPDGTETRKFRPKHSIDGKATKERKGIDFTFSAPKSVSIQALVNGDTRLVEAHDAAVRDSLAELESLAMTRRKEKGVTYRENSANLIFASFRHELSRAQDPQLHTHNIAMNLTQRADGAFRSLSNERMLKNVKQVGAFYRANLAARLKALGYELRDGPKGTWELAEISEKAVRHFSKRSKEIEAALDRMGRDRGDATGPQKQVIALASREKKTEEDRAVLKEYWEATAKEAGLSLNPFRTTADHLAREARSIKQRLTPNTVIAKRDVEAADVAVNFAIAHLAEREGIFTHGELLETAYKRGATTTTTAAIADAATRAAKDGRLLSELPLLRSARSLDAETRAAIGDPGSAHFKQRNELEQFTRSTWVTLTAKSRELSQEEAAVSVDNAIARGALVPAEPRYTTPIAKANELAILAIEKEGRAKVPAITTTNELTRFLDRSALNQEQRNGAALMLTTTSRYIAVQGFAGTGKSRMLSEAARALDAVNATSHSKPYRFIGLAPYASQVKALEEVGWSGQTLASFLSSHKQRNSLDPHSVVLLDEASVVPAHQMLDLMRAIEKSGARLILSGDRKQTAAIEAGKPFAQLLDAGIEKTTLTDIQRQKDPTLKKAVLEAANDDIAASVQTLHNRIVQIPPDEKRHQAIARAYFGLSIEERDKTLIVVGTNEARATINKEIRALLGLKDKAILTTLHEEDRTRAEKALASSYPIGAVIVSARTSKNGLTRDLPYAVVDTNPKRNTLIVTSPSGERITINPAQNKTISTYKTMETALAVNDWVRLSRNDPATGARRGARYKVESITDDALLLKNEKGELRLPRSSAMHLEHGYATTVHSAQGLTQDRVLVDANTKSLTSNRAVYYVAISRPRFDVTLYTDDQAKLGRAMGREPKKYAALDLRDARNEAFYSQTKAQQIDARVPKR